MAPLVQEVGGSDVWDPCFSPTSDEGVCSTKGKLKDLRSVYPEDRV